MKTTKQNLINEINRLNELRAPKMNFKNLDLFNIRYLTNVVEYLKSE